MEAIVCAPSIFIGSRTRRYMALFARAMADAVTIAKRTIQLQIFACTKQKSSLKFQFIFGFYNYLKLYFVRNSFDRPSEIKRHKITEVIKFYIYVRIGV